MSAPFIVVDGVDGAGKGVQIERLRDVLVREGRAVHVTAEPSTFPIGVMIRRWLRRELPEPPPPPDAMALLFAADRLEHVAREIDPCIAAGTIVLCDRYDAASIAYQSALVDPSEEEAMMSFVAAINARARRPTLTLLLDVPPEIAAARRARRGTPEELYERATMQRRVRENYRKLARVRPDDRIVVVDASPPVDEVHARIVAAVRAVVT